MTNLRRQFKRKLSSKEDKLQPLPGVAGDGLGNLKDSNGRYYVRIGGQVQVVSSANIQPRYEQPVWVGYEPAQPGVFKILNERVTGGSVVSFNGPARHANTHEWMGPGAGGGSDVVKIQSQQIMPLRVMPYTGFQVAIWPGLVRAGESIVLIGDLNGYGKPVPLVEDLSSYAYGVHSGKAKFLLITLDTTGAVVLSEGSEVDISNLALTDIPAAPAGTMYVLAAVRLWFGQDAITENRETVDIVDLRWPYALLVDGATGGSGTDGDAIHDNVANEISAITEKTNLAADDMFMIEDSEDSNAKKMVKASNFKIGIEVNGLPKYNAIGTITHIIGNVTIIDNGLHNGFPGACVLADGTIKVVYRVATDHNSVNGVIKSKSSTDGGATWGAESTIYTHATLDARDPSITRLRNGNLVLTVKLFVWATTKPDYSVVLISTDNGSSWGSAIEVGEAFTSYGGCSSPVIEMADDVLLLATFGLDTGDTYQYARLVRSGDGGATWTNIGIIAKSASRHYQEPNLCALPNGELLCFLRSDTENHFYLSRSSDGGETWTTPVDLFSAGGRPNIARLSNGTLFLSYRQKSIAGDHAVYRVSIDNGYNWGDEQVMDTSGIMAYSALVEKNAGSFGLVFAIQLSSANADMFYSDFYATSDFVPGLHASRHQSGGMDAIKIDDLAPGDDNTDLDASTTKHGLMMKFPGGTTSYLRADGTFAAPGGGAGTGDVVGPEGAIDNHLAVFDGTTGKLIKDGGAIPAGSSTDGWVSEANTWSYSSADAPTFVASVNADLTGILSPGMRIKLTQTTVKYFIVTAVGSFSGGVTLITLFGGTEYTLADAAISSPFFSTNKAPFGFPLNPAKWTVEVINTGTNDQANPTQNQWYNLGSISVVLPIGIWLVSYQLSTQANDGSSIGLRQQVSLSTSNNSVSDANFTTNVGISSGTVQQISIYRERVVLITSKTTYYLISMSATSGLDNLRIGSVGSASPTIIRAVSVYL